MTQIHYSPKSLARVAAALCLGDGLMGGKPAAAALGSALMQFSGTTLDLPSERQWDKETDAATDARMEINRLEDNNARKSKAEAKRKRQAEARDRARQQAGKV